MLHWNMLSIRYFLVLCLNFRTALLTVGSNAVAIFRPFPEIFKIFDAHSRDLYGRPSFGSCILISVEGLQNLVNYFRLTSPVQNIVPFELKGVTCILQNEIPCEPLVNKNCQIPVATENNYCILNDCEQKKERQNYAKMKQQS